MNKYVIALVTSIALISFTTVFAAQGRVTGGQAYTIPSWFKLSFLQIQEETKEAEQENKHVMLFMHIDNCPYCSRSLNENFRSGDNKKFIQKHFNVIALHIRGDREVAWDKESTYTEKELARKLNVIATPTIVFLNSKGDKVYQMNGYRKPAAFRDILDYVNEKQYNKMKLVEYIAKQNKSRYKFKSNPSFISITDFSKEKGPLAVIFEDKSCADCDEFHKEVLQHKGVMKEMKKLKFVRLDAYSTTPITDNEGNKTTPQNWVKTLKLDYRPGTVLFNEGEEIARMDGRFYHFDYKEKLRYVSGKFYKHYPRFFAYLRVREKELLDTGIDINFGK